LIPLERAVPVTAEQLSHFSSGSAGAPKDIKLFCFPPTQSAPDSKRVVLSEGCR